MRMRTLSGPISDMARQLLGMKTLGVATASAGGAGGGGMAAPAASPRAAGLGGGAGTGVVDEGYWASKRAADQAKRDADAKAIDTEWSGMMGDAAKKTSAFNANANKEWAANEALKSPTASTFEDRFNFKPQPTGEGGKPLATDQNGGTGGVVGASGPTEDGSTQDEDQQKEEDEQGYDTASADSGGEPRATGGPVRAGGLYRVAEGNKPEVYVQNDGDVYPLTREARIRPREGGVIVPNPQVAKLSRAELNQRRSEIDRRAKSGEIDALPAHYRTQDEQAAMAPILAKREADTKKAEAQAREELGRKNPYALAPERDKAYVGETARLERLAAMQSDPRTRQDLMNQARMRQQGTMAASTKAQAVDTANDPYVKIKNEEAKDQQQAMRQQQQERDAAMRDIATRFKESPESFFEYGGQPALDQAAEISRQYTARQLGLAGGSSSPAMAGRPGASVASQPAQPGSQPASVPPQPGGQTPPLPDKAGMATSLPTGETTPASGKESQGKGFDHVAIARILNDPKVKPEYKEQIHANMTPEQRTVVRYSMESTPQYDAALKAANVAKKSVSIGDTLGEMGRVARRRLGFGEASPQPQQAESQPSGLNVGERIRMALAPATEQAATSVRSSVYPTERSQEPSQDWQQIGSAISGGARAAVNELGQAPSMDKGSLADRALRWVRDPYGLAARNQGVDSNPRASLGR